jgi:precorrin-4 methylase
METKTYTAAVSNEQVQWAIDQGKAVLKTHLGILKVTGYRHDTGWAVTSNGGWMDQKSFMVCVSDILIEEGR